MPMSYRPQPIDVLLLLLLQSSESGLYEDLLVQGMECRNRLDQNTCTIQATKGRHYQLLTP